MSPGALAILQQMILASAESESESESEPGSSHYSTYSTPQPSPPQPHPDELASAATTTNPEADTFLNDALKQKIKVFGGLGAAVGVSAGLAYGVHKLIKGPSQSYVSACFPFTSNRITNILTCVDLPQRTRW